MLIKIRIKIFQNDAQNDQKSMFFNNENNYKKCQNEPKIDQNHGLYIVHAFWPKTPQNACFFHNQK
jgi:hypothetical protein